jgi:BirA family biotin operon repressor/biotin-[acetyl-CoA-carboxylase] ligase
LQHFDQIASTNAQMLDWAARDAPERAPQRALICAEWQSQGRGRRGRDWYAGLGGGLMFSFLWRSTRPAAQLSGLSLAVGVALVEGLREFGLAGARVKWPNDIQVAGAKLAGVLIELASDKLASDVLAPSTAVIGIGLNVSGGESLSQRVGQPVTDLSAHLSAHLGHVDRNQLLLCLVIRGSRSACSLGTARRSTASHWGSMRKARCRLKPPAAFRLSIPVKSACEPFRHDAVGGCRQHAHQMAHR